MALLDLQRHQEFENHDTAPVESKISKVMSESITQTVIVIILLMLLFSPITDEDVYTSEANVGYIMLCKYFNNLLRLPKFENATQNSQEKFGSYLIVDMDPAFPILNITYLNITIWDNKNITGANQWRTDEKGYAFSPDGPTLVTYSNKTSTYFSALLNLFRTLFVIFILGLMANSAEKDSKNIILDPLEVMIDVVDSVARDPINFKIIENLKNKIKLSIDKVRIKEKSKKDNFNSKAFDVSKEGLEGAEYEIKIIQLAIIKISALLAIGFGEAGGEILEKTWDQMKVLTQCSQVKRKWQYLDFVILDISRI